jgi:hypothetical protein
MVEPLIKLKRSLDEALSVRDSQINTIYIFRGIHLLPNNYTKYVQVTDIEEGINLEDWTVNAVNLCNGKKTDITESFNVDSLTNSLNGNPQLYWSLYNVTHDFGYNLIYLEITQTLGETFYSTPFMITDYYKEKTTQFHYKAKKDDVMQSIGIQAWFRQLQRNEELTQYYETSTKTTVTTTQKLNKLEKYITELMPIETIDLFMDVLSSPYLYVDSVRASLYESPKIPDLVGTENFGKFDFIISPKKWDIYKEADPTKGDWISTDWLSTDFNIYTQ